MVYIVSILDAFGNAKAFDSKRPAHRDNNLRSGTSHRVWGLRARRKNQSRHRPGNAGPSVRNRAFAHGKDRAWRMLAASHMVTSMFPDRDAFTDVDLSNRKDPVANAFYDAVQQVGLSVGQRPSQEETAQRVAAATRLATSGTLPTSFLRAGVDGRVDIADVVAAGSLDNTAINNQYNRHITQFLEGTVPYMPATSQQGAVAMAKNYVESRGAAMGSSFVMPPPNEPSIRAQMFPGQKVENPAAVNTAIVEWMQSEEALAAVPQLADWYEANAPVDEFLRRISPFSTANPGTRSAPDFTVTRLNGQYVANILGVGSIVLPLREIGDHYKSTR